MKKNVFRRKESTLSLRKEREQLARKIEEEENKKLRMIMVKSYKERKA